MEGGRLFLVCDVMEETVLHTERLTKRYGTKSAVEEVSISVSRGEVYGFLGPNGAGKTTVMMMLLGLIRPTQGKINLFGVPFGGSHARIRRRMGAVSEKPYLYPEMTAVEYLKFFADLYDIDHPTKRIQELLEKLGLSDAAGNRLGTFSRGMQQKISIARALVHDPELLLFDEPVSGLDPRGIRQVRDLMKEARTNGKTIFVSSHLLSEAERVCGRVAIMNRGRLLIEETMAGIRKRLSGESTLEIEVKQLRNHIMEAVSRLPSVKYLSQTGDVLSIKVEPGVEVRESVSRTITEAGGTVVSMNLKELSLEDAFLTLTNQNISLLNGSEAHE